MFKILTLGILFFLLYRLVFSPFKSLETSETSDVVEESDTIDIDYEDVDN